MPPGGVRDNALGTAFQKYVKYDAARVVLRDPSNGTIERDLIGIAVAEEEFADVVPVDGRAKRQFELRTRRHHIDDLTQALAPGQQALVRGQSADIEMDRNDAVLGCQACTGQALTMRQEGWHCGGRSSRRDHI